MNDLITEAYLSIISQGQPLGKKIGPEANLKEELGKAIANKYIVNFQYTTGDNKKFTMSVLPVAIGYRFGNETLECYVCKTQEDALSLIQRNRREIYLRAINKDNSKYNADLGDPKFSKYLTPRMQEIKNYPNGLDELSSRFRKEIRDSKGHLLFFAPLNQQRLWQFMAVTKDGKFARPFGYDPQTNEAVLQVLQGKSFPKWVNDNTGIKRKAHIYYPNYDYPTGSLIATPKYDINGQLEFVFKFSQQIQEFHLQKANSVVTWSL